MTKEELIQAISDDKMMPFIQPEQLAGIVDFVIKNYKPSLPLNLGEVTMDFARELDFFLYGSYTPERFPNSMSVRDEHSGLNVNDWKCWVNRPELKIEMVKHFFTLGKQAGAEWMAGQGAFYNTKVGWIDGPTVLDWPDDILDKFEMGDEVIVQIRKK